MEPRSREMPEEGIGCARHALQGHHHVPHEIRERWPERRELRRGSLRVGGEERLRHQGGRPTGLSGLHAVLAVASATAFAGAMCETYVAVVASEECPRSCWMTGREVPPSTWPKAHPAGASTRFAPSVTTQRRIGRPAFPKGAFGRVGWAHQKRGRAGVAIGHKGNSLRVQLSPAIHRASRH